MDQVLTGKNLSLGYEKGQDRKVILSDLISSSIQDS